jgi:large subunit ribosomal protein L17
MGDNAEMAMIELVDFNEFFEGFGKEKAAAKKTTRRSRSRAKGTTEAAEVA